MNVLVTGGAGYIGSHVVNVLKKEQGFTPIVYDNFSTGHPEAVSDDVQLVEGDIRDVQFLKHIMAQFEIDAVIHFAASSLVGESMSDPAKYYVNNVEGSLHLLQAMKEAGVDYIVFSSTAAFIAGHERSRCRLYCIFFNGGGVRRTGKNADLRLFSDSAYQCLRAHKTCY